MKEHCAGKYVVCLFVAKKTAVAVALHGPNRAEISGESGQSAQCFAKPSFLCCTAQSLMRTATCTETVHVDHHSVATVATGQFFCNT